MCGTCNKAEGKPRISFYDVAGIVAAVVTLASDALVAFDFLSKGVLTAGEY